MTEQLKDYCEQEGIPHDDIINAEIEQEHKENEKRSEKFQNDVDSLIDEIKTSQAAKKTYFAEVLEGKHPGKKLMQQKIIIRLAEVIDYDKNKLIYEETEEDKKANNQYLRSCITKIDKAALQFANELQKFEKFSIEEFNLFSREYKGSPLLNVKVKAIDLTDGNPKKLSEVPPEVLKAVKNVLEKAIVTEEKGAEKGAESV